MRISRLFGRYLTGNLAIVILLLLCVVPVYYLSLHMARQVERANISATLKKGGEVFIENMYSYNSSLAILKNNSDFRTLVALSGINRPPDTLLASRVRAQLTNLIAPIGLHSEAVLAFTRNELVLDTHRLHYSRSSHYGEFLMAEGMALSEWLDATLFAPPDSMTVAHIHLHQADSSDFLIINFSIELGGDRSATLSLLIDLDDLLALFIPEGILPQAAVLLDTNGGERLLSLGYDGPTPEGGAAPVSQPLDGVATDVWSLPISTPNLRVTLLVPQTVYQEALRPIRLYVLSFMLLAVFLGVTAALALAYRNMLPMRRLAGRLSGVLHQKEGDRDIYHTIERTVSGLNMSLGQFSDKLDDMGKILRHNQFDWVLHGYLMGEGKEHTLPNAGRLLLVGFNRAGKAESEVTLVSATNLLRSALGAGALCHVVGPRLIAVLAPLDALSGGDAELRTMLQAIRRQIAALSGGDVRLLVSPAYASLDAVSDLFWAMRNRFIAHSTALDEVDFPPPPEGRPASLSTGQLHRLYNIAISGVEQDVTAFFAQEVYPLTEALDRVEGIRLFYALSSVVCEAARQVGAPVDDSAFNERLPIQPQLSQLESDILTVAHHVRNARHNRDEHMRRELRQYLEDHYADSALCLAMVADHFGLSQKYTSAFIKEQTGQSYSEYVEKLRMDNAVILLRNSSLSVQQVAEAIGFSSLNTFYKAFKRSFGVSPNIWRRT